MTVSPAESGAPEPPAAASECNECNEALKMARDAVAMDRRLALVAENALVNGDLRRVRSVLRDLQDMTFAPLARRPGWSAELR